MLQTKTHFEQIPLSVVRKIVEEQIRRAEAAERAQVSLAGDQLKVCTTTEHVKVPA